MPIPVLSFEEAKHHKNQHLFQFLVYYLFFVHLSTKQGTQSCRAMEHKTRGKTATLENNCLSKHLGPQTFIEDLVFVRNNSGSK